MTDVPARAKPSAALRAGLLVTSECQSPRCGSGLVWATSEDGYRYRTLCPECHGFGFVCDECHRPLDWHRWGCATDKAMPQCYKDPYYFGDSFCVGQEEAESRWTEGEVSDADVL